MIFCRKTLSLPWTEPLSNDDVIYKEIKMADLRLERPLKFLVEEGLAKLNFTGPIED